MTIHDVHICTACLRARVCKFMLLTLVVLGAFSCSSKAPSPFSDKTIKEYASMATLREEAQQGAYIAGKVVLINTGESISHHYQTAFTRDDDIEIESQTVSSLQEKINNRAENPDEVGAVVLLKWTRELLRENAVGIEFCRVVCEVTIVDHTKHCIVGKRQFAGSNPEGTHRWGSSPENEIVAYINGLPRRNPATAPAERGASPEASNAPTDARKYTDTTNKLSFAYPSTWKEMTSAEARKIMGANTSKYLTVVLSDPADSTQNVNVQVLPTAAEELSEAAFREFEASMDRQLPDSFPGFHKLSSRVGRLLDMPSLEYVFEATRPDGVRLRQKQLRTGKPGRELVLTFSARAEKYDAADARCFSIITNTLKLE